MASFKYVKKSGPSGSSHGTTGQPSTGGAKLNIDGGIPSRHAKENGYSGTQQALTGTYAQSNARISSKTPANGSRHGAGDIKIGKGNAFKGPEVGSSRGAKPPGGAPALRVSAKGPSPAFKAAPSIASQKNKNLTQSGSAHPADNSGLSGSFNGRNATGQTGSGIGLDKKHRPGS